MRTAYYLTTAFLLAAPADAYAGCATGAAVGGVAAGCVIGHHEAVKHQREAQAQAAASQAQQHPQQSAPPKQ
jgi:hypothetical protein